MYNEKMIMIIMIINIDIIIACPKHNTLDIALKGFMSEEICTVIYVIFVTKQS